MVPKSWPAGRRIWAPAGDGWVLLRRDFELPDDPRSATLFVTASSCEPARQFVHRTHVNGRLVCLGPTRSLPDEHLVDTIDLTGLLGQGRNSIAALCWSIAESGYQALLVIELPDDSIVTIHTDGQWRSAGQCPCATLGDCGTWAFTAPQEIVDADALEQLLSAPLTGDHAWGPVTTAPAFSCCRSNPTRPLSVEAVAPVASWDLDDAMVLDFGRVLMGGLDLRLAGKAATIEVRLGEELADDGHVADMRTGNDYRDLVTTAGSASSAQTWGVRCFRYASVSRPDAITQVTAQALRQPGFGDHSFASSDPALDEVWQLCADTVRNHSAAPFCDSWSRERAPYEADAYLHALSFLCLNDDPTPVAHTLDFLLAQRTWPTEWPFFAVMLAAHEFRWTGDAARLREVWPACVDALPLRWIDPGSGLVCKCSGITGSHSESDCDIVDWPASCRDDYRFGPVNTVVNTVAWRAIRDLAEAGREAGVVGADALATTAENLGRAINRRLLDLASGRYVDGLDEAGQCIDHRAIHSTLFPVALGLAPANATRALVESIEHVGVQFSVYPAGLLLPRLLQLDEHGAARRLLLGDGDRSWAAMLRQNAGGTMEAWNTTDKPNATFSHPWSASPVAAMAHGVLGIQVTTPGWQQVHIEPHLGWLDWAEMGLPTPMGNLRVRAEANGALVVGAPESMQVTTSARWSLRRAR